jgi:hypothetical protein
MKTLFQIYIGLAIIIALTSTALTLEALDRVCVATTGMQCELYHGQFAAMQERMMQP